MKRNKEAVAAQKALGVVVGDWIIFPRSGVAKPRPMQARKEHLDARGSDFLRWRRATENEVAARQTEDAVRAKEAQVERELKAQPKYVAAQRLTWPSQEEWMCLPLDELQRIGSLLDKATA